MCIGDGIILLTNEASVLKYLSICDGLIKQGWNQLDQPDQSDQQDQATSFK
jgi:hypothetical protein